MAPLTESQTKQIVTEIRQGRKIQAIKLMREFTGFGLAEAKDAVERMEAEGSARPSSDSATPPQGNSLAKPVVDALLAGRKIEAIRLHRQRTGLGLKEAKDEVEAYAKSVGLDTGRKGGCGTAALLLAAGLAGAWWVLREVTRAT